MPQPRRSGRVVDTTSGAQGTAFSPAKDAGGGELVSGTSKHHLHTLMFSGDKQIQTGFNL